MTMEDTEAWGAEGEPVPQDDPEPLAEGTGEAKEYKDYTLWKKWSVAGGVKRFLTISPWMEAGMVSVDIGEAKEGLSGHSLVWASMLELTTYLEAVRDGRGEYLYPADQRNSVPTAEGYTHFGGGKVNDRPISRILKVHHWATKEGYDSSAFVWKCGHFPARVSNTGAFIPDMGSPLSIHSIKASRREMAEMATAMHMAMVNMASTTPSDEWLESISGRRKN